MKILLAALMCFVLCSSECFALKGGPVYPATTASISGTYAGVMQGVFDPTNPRSQNTLALFSLKIPQTGLADGVVVVFVAGRTFVGTMAGVGNPNTTTVSGVIQATSETTIVLCPPPNNVIIIDPSSVDVTDRADGTLNASIRTTRQAVVSVSGTLLVGTAAITASLTVRNPDPANCTSTVTIPSAISLQVDGFKQSDST
jgi:hypothetical protein